MEPVGDENNNGNGIDKVETIHGLIYKIQPDKFFKPFSKDHQIHRAPQDEGYSWWSNHYLELSDTKRIFTIESSDLHEELAAFTPFSQEDSYRLDNRDFDLNTRRAKVKEFEASADVRKIDGMQQLTIVSGDTDLESDVFQQPYELLTEQQKQLLGNIWVNVVVNGMSFLALPKFRDVHIGTDNKTGKPIENTQIYYEHFFPADTGPLPVPKIPGLHEGFPIYIPRGKKALGDIKVRFINAPMSQDQDREDI